MNRGEPVLIDRMTRATFIRSLGDGNAIVAIGADTRVVLEVSINPEPKLSNR